ncbi:MAG: mannosyl-oligosaccharide alpha-1,2-mannosidase [Caeruleum heppii]|nr:MAG: mannosyl-oligosaccharide alpha-1,2-mannosidase [Caeruleum heppii]
MNNSDPFGLRRSSALSILQSRASVVAASAASLSRHAIDTGRQTLREATSSNSGPIDPSLDDMSFSLPNKVPAFTDPQRRLEDSRWGSAGAGLTARGGISNGVGEKIGGFFEKKELPMYKDKPYTYAASGRQRSIWKRKPVIAGVVLFFLAVLYLLGVFTRTEKVQSSAGRGGKTAWSWLKNGQQGIVDWDSRRERVREAFILSWDAYERNAWGFDEYHPVSKKGRQMIDKGMGWIIVDALDTLMIMNLTSRLTHAREWITTSLDYDQDHEVNTFETTIRMLGGLLSAHYLSTTYPNLAGISDDNEGAPGEDLYLEKAIDLADRLLGAFDSDSGVPYASVNLRTMKGIPSHADGGASSTAEASSLQLEMKYVAKLTGERNYWDKAEKVMKVIDDNGAQDGLLPIFIYATTGGFRGDNIRLGSRGDSYYEYLIKQYLQTSLQEPVYMEMWNEALAGVRKHLITYSNPSNLTVLGERPDGLHGTLSPKMDHLVCFMPGTIALAVTGGHTEEEARRSGHWGPKQDEEMKLARDLTQTCYGMYKVTRTGLAPEIAHFNIYDPPLTEKDDVRPLGFLDDGDDATWRSDYVLKSNDLHNLQRPETVESLLYMYRITGDEMYRRWGWEMFKAFVEYTDAGDGGGFTSLNSVQQIPPSKRDNMESFWLVSLDLGFPKMMLTRYGQAETLKYFYLLFSPPDFLPLDQVVINTEAHFFPRFELGKLFSTGWQRRPRDSQGKIVPQPEEHKREDVAKAKGGRTSTETVVVAQTKTFSA